MAKTCRPFHELLVAESFTAMGAFVHCLRCKDSLHIAESTLLDHYYHAHHVSGDGIFGKDLDFFIIEGLVEGRKR